MECSYCFDLKPPKRNEISSTRLQECLLHAETKNFQQEAYFKDKGIVPLLHFSHTLIFDVHMKMNIIHFYLLAQLASNELGKRVYGESLDGDIIIIDVSTLSPSTSRHTDIIFHVYEHSLTSPTIEWSGHHYVEQQGLEEPTRRVVKIIACFKSLLSILPKRKLHVIYCDNGPKDFKVALLMDSLVEIGISNTLFLFNLDHCILINIEKEYGCQLIWNFFGENHGGSACDADGNIARNYLNNYVRNETISLNNNNSKIVSLISEIKNQKGHEITNEMKYEHIQENLFQGVTYF